MNAFDAIDCANEAAVAPARPLQMARMGGIGCIIRSSWLKGALLLQFCKGSRKGAILTGTGVECRFESTQDEYRVEDAEKMKDRGVAKLQRI